MKTYVYRMNSALERNPEGTVANGTVACWGYYVFITDDKGEVVDMAGPFDDEHDAEMAARRAEEIAA